MSILNIILCPAESETIHEYLLHGADNNYGLGGPAELQEMFPALTAVSIIAGIFIALIFGGILLLASSKVSERWKGRWLRISFIMVWLYGLVVYDIGMCTGEYISLITNAPMAVLYAFKIFLLDSDVSEIHEVFHSSWVYSLNFALVHFLAAIISTLFVIKYFGFNIQAKCRMWLENWRKHIVDETYVVWGFNEASLEMIDSINSHYEKVKDGTTYRIVLVRLNSGDDDDPETRSGIGRIFDFLSIQNSELEELLKLNCFTAGTYTNLQNINKSKEGEDLLGLKLKLGSLKQMLANKTRKKIHMLFLGDNEEHNLHAVSLLMKDKTLVDFTNTPGAKHEVLFYCHARQNSVHRVIEDRSMRDNMFVSVVDSSHKSVENLKRDENLLPVNFVKVEGDATVSSAFNALIVGFSEVGQDALRFLYEYGAFVSSESTDDNVMRSAFHIHAVDKQMGDIAGAFVANAPALEVSVPFIKDMKKDNALITLNRMDCQGIEFYENLKEWIKTLNYIVIATDDDELNITVAVRIFKMALRCRDHFRDLCILTRVHEDKDGHIREIAEYYNRLWMAQEAVKNYDGKIATQSTVRRDAPSSSPIHLFGLDNETYTYDNIIDNSMLYDAVRFKERYEASTKATYNEKEDFEQTAWYTVLRDNILCVNGDPDAHPTLSAVAGIRRQQGQDFANYYHETTKLLLTQKALRAAHLPNFEWSQLSRKSNTTVYNVGPGIEVAPQIFRILNVLAQTEHLRWNASHEILGYTDQGDFPSRNEVKMTHSCIKPWQNLTVDIQSFDYNVVDVTLNIINPDHRIEGAKDV